MNEAYIHTEQVHNFSAAEEVMPFLLHGFSPTSILDVGCGTGTWLKVAQDLGVPDVLGVDGTYVPLHKLRMETSKFQGVDLREPFRLDRSFDLILSLEVAEHLPEASAKGFIESITAHGDVVLFSAAIPNQGGQYHVNEQWPSYWAKLFDACGFDLYDVMRARYWDNPKVDFWYKQNMFLFLRRGTTIPAWLASVQPGMQWPEKMIHPGLVEHLTAELSYRTDQVLMLQRAPGLKKAWKTFWKELASKMTARG